MSNKYCPHCNSPRCSMEAKFDADDNKTIVVEYECGAIVENLDFVDRGKKCYENEIESLEERIRTLEENQND